VIAGGGVAALEAMLALRALAGDRVELELLAPEPHFWYRPLAVAEPFAIGQAHRIEIVELAEAAEARVTLSALAAVDPEEHRVRTTGGAEFEYDALLLACGARPRVAVAGALTFRGPADTDRLRRLLLEVEAGTVRRLVFAMPGGAVWPLPLYELALLTASHVSRARLERTELALVSPEPTPLSVLGRRWSAAVAGLLEERSVRFHGARHPLELENGELVLAGGGSLPADAAVALPRLEGPSIEGIPAGADGFVSTDLHGRVGGLRDVFAAGDMTAFPVKQGGIAAQQAEAAAQAIAALAGARVVPQPFRPVLRGVLLTGGAPCSPFRPPSKIVALHLPRLLAAHGGFRELDAGAVGLSFTVELEPQHQGAKRSPTTSRLPTAAGRRRPTRSEAGPAA
jgi:sulfide:quinone oxidoreductase